MRSGYSAQTPEQEDYVQRMKEYYAKKLATQKAASSTSGLSMARECKRSLTRHQKQHKIK